jgi:hypothetical protein
MSENKWAYPHVTPTSMVTGMSLREYYIGQALAGLCANPGLNWEQPDAKETAEWAIEVADEVMRAKKND